MAKRKRKPHIAVSVGDRFRIPRKGKPAHHVRLTRIVGRKSNQPKAKYVLTTRGGKRKTRKGEEITTWLTWSQDLGQWTVPWAGAELLKGESHDRPKRKTKKAEPRGKNDLPVRSLQKGDRTGGGALAATGRGHPAHRGSPRSTPRVHNL